MEIRSSLRLARVARGVAAAAATLEGLSVEEVGDIQLLVDAAFNALYVVGSDTVRLRLQLTAGCATVEMRGDRAVVPVDTSALRELAATLAIDSAVAFGEPTPRFSARLRAVASD
jgi:hypothetical protein